MHCKDLISLVRRLERYILNNNGINFEPRNIPALICLYSESTHCDGHNIGYEGFGFIK